MITYRCDICNEQCQRNELVDTSYVIVQFSLRPASRADSGGRCFVTAGIGHPLHIEVCRNCVLKALHEHVCQKVKELNLD